MTITVYIDADACPVKEETYKVAARYGLRTVVVSNSFIQIPPSPLIARMIVPAGADVADDWIAGEVVAGDVVVTNDIPLAARVLAKAAHAIAPYGRAFTEQSIGLALAQRALMEHIRSTGEITGGPPPFIAANRSQFLQELDRTIVREKRRRSEAGSVGGDDL
jgi:uncharacterized protein